VGFQITSGTSLKVRFERAGGRVSVMFVTTPNGPVRAEKTFTP